MVPVVGEVDRRLVDAANGGLGGMAAALATGIDAVFGPLPAAALTALIALVTALLRRSALQGVRAGALVMIPWGLAEALKLVVRRPRPEAESLRQQLVPPPESFSYPSGHTAVAAAFCLAILLSLPAGPGRRFGAVLTVLIVAITAWSRVALGLHHPSDVLASALLVPVTGVLLARMIDAWPAEAH
ncbi:hypothetical protein GCM10009626_39150 [Brachybacterium sacelli]